MKEFIVWHTLRKEFVQPYRNIVFDDSGITENDLCTIHNYIGLKDINNNKIYADSSIVELQIDDDFSNDHFTSTEPHKFIGVVRFDYLGARVEDINDKTTVWFYEIENNEIDIKIIDTVQQNKLGLIKE